jgi:ATP-dependent helicase Lhr and Lhr-like helicase
VPDHPLVNQALHDALEEAMDLAGLTRILERLAAGEIECASRDTPEPSVFCHELLNSAVYTFLDDAPLEERRTRAVYTRRSTEPRSADDLGALDAAAIARVREEAWPVATTPDELHDALLLAGFMREDEIRSSIPDAPSSLPLAAERSPLSPGSPGERFRVRENEYHWPALMGELVAAGRAVRSDGYWIAIERFEELNALVPLSAKPAIPQRIRKQWTAEDAARELMRGRLEVLGPVTAPVLARSLELHSPAPVDRALLALENEGRVMRGYFTPQGSFPHPQPFSRREKGESASSNPSPSDPSDRGVGVRESESPPLEWCDRRLLARIHRYTVNRLRAEIEAVTAADFMRFLLHWQHVAPDEQVSGVEGLAALVEQLDGYELAAGAWEHDVLPARMRDYESNFIDILCLSGRVGWGRVTPMEGAGKAPLKTSPIALMMRSHANLWRAPSVDIDGTLSSEARAVYEALRARGASFFHELVSATRLLRTQVERALGELAGAGLVTADSFSGLRALLTPTEKRKRLGGRVSARRSAFGVDTAGRWALLGDGAGVENDERAETIARVLLRRYGVVFRALLARESRLPPWRDLVTIYRRLEARGEIRGGRFVAGFGGEQFALSEAVGRLRAIRKLERTGELLVLAAADPLNLVGIVTPGARITAIARNRILCRDGVPIAAWEGGEVRRLTASELDDEALRALLSRRHGPHGPRPYLRTATDRERQMLERARTTRRMADAVLLAKAKLH